jgi:hypothetical protein
VAAANVLIGGSSGGGLSAGLFAAASPSVEVPAACSSFETSDCATSVSDDLSPVSQFTTNHPMAPISRTPIAAPATVVNAPEFDFV